MTSMKNDQDSYQIPKTSVGNTKSARIQEISFNSFIENLKK